VVPLAQALNPTTYTTDEKAFVAFLDSQAPVARNRKIRTMGYCMGGPMVMRTAADSRWLDTTGAVRTSVCGG
jgi:carboxymethylenebutenolidase